MSRITSTLLKRAGLEELITDNHADYVKLALTIARDQDFRRKVNRQMAVNGSKIFNDREQLHDLEETLLALWKRGS